MIAAVSSIATLYDEAKIGNRKKMKGYKRTSTSKSSLRNVSTLSNQFQPIFHERKKKEKKIYRGLVRNCEIINVFHQQVDFDLLKTLTSRKLGEIWMSYNITCLKSIQQTRVLFSSFSILHAFIHSHWPFSNSPLDSSKIVQIFIAAENHRQETD